MFNVPEPNDKETLNELKSSENCTATVKKMRRRGSIKQHAEDANCGTHPLSTLKFSSSIYS